MKAGRFHAIPEKLADLKALWNRARVLENDNLPEWLTPDDSAGYRYLGAISGTGLSGDEQPTYFAELEELEAARLIVDPDPYDSHTHHLFLAAPQNEAVWAIGIYQGSSPLELASPPELHNPVLTADDVTDVPAAFVADPFLVRTRDGWHMFFEVMNWRGNKGEIGWATSVDGRAWKYGQIVLAEPFHLSYPYVFEWGGVHYLIPESYQANAIRLYKARKFPTDWVLVKPLIEAPYLVDASLFRHQDMWWILTDASEEMGNDTLRLFGADDLLGPWREHPRSPLLERDPRNARPGGRVTPIDGRLFRFAQSCEPFYGTDLRAFEITELTPTTYAEAPYPGNPILGPSQHGWNACGMHHIDPHLLKDGRWLASVDGWCWG